MPVYHFTANGLPMTASGAEATSIHFPAHVTNARGAKECCANVDELRNFLKGTKCFHNVTELDVFLNEYCGDNSAIPKVRSPKKRQFRRDAGPDFYSAYA